MTGLDPSAGMLEVMAANAPEVSGVLGSGAEMPFDDHSFDLTLTVAALHHVPPGGGDGPPAAGNPDSAYAERVRAVSVEQHQLTAIDHDLGARVGSELRAQAGEAVSIPLIDRSAL